MTRKRRCINVQLKNMRSKGQVRLNQKQGDFSNMKKAKQNRIALLLLTLFVIISGCGHNTSSGKVDNIRERGTLLVGTAGDYQPMSYLNPETGQ